jgi:hypothetical protein
MKSRVINAYRAMSQWPSRGFLRLSPTNGIALGGALCALTLSGCYYPPGYYPSAYYPPYYQTVPATAAVQSDPSDPQQQQQAQAQPQGAPQGPPPTYAVAAPPVYVAPAYPAYYPPPVYPAYYGGYPGYYGPSVSIGIGGYWGGGWGHHWH